MDKIISIFLATITLAIILSPIIILGELISRSRAKKDISKNIAKQYSQATSPYNNYYPYFEVDLMPYSETTNNYDSYCPYHKVDLFTENEKTIYRELNRIAESKNLKVLAKIRMADLVNVNHDIKSRYFKDNLYRISSKHIDFALCEPDWLQPVLLIEVDDSSHTVPDRVKRDIFINEVYEKTGYKLLRIYGIQNLEDKITNEISNLQKQLIL